MSFGPRLPGLTDPEVETHEFAGGERVVRQVLRRDGTTVRTSLPTPAGSESLSAHSAFDLAWLRAATRPEDPTDAPTVRVVDLFAGCGGLSVGIREATRALGLRMEAVLANDLEAPILGIYGRNFPEAEIVCAPVESLFDGECGSDPTDQEATLRDRLGRIDVLVGGPPCQGHSDFNNHTRHDDPKNELYLRMARFCEVVRPTHVVIENVPGVERDRRRSAQRTWALLEDLGYEVSTGVIDASRIGAAQRRRRSITLASLAVTPSVAELVTSLEVKPRPVDWAIGDLEHVVPTTLLDQHPSPSAENQRRIDHLFDHALYDLPDSERPDCHRLKAHTYKAVYGRLAPDKPAPTITTGFGSMGRGRNVHPRQRRTITLHEAARVQFFPDFFDFGDASRSLIQKVIGNAVPPKLGYAIGLHLLR
jgi:DNA (cytosine-5)-methyltransferase 1